MPTQRFLVIASIFGALAVILGAFGAHGLEKAVDAKMLQRFHTGVEYQFYHTFALFLVGLSGQWWQHRYLAYAGYAFITGIILFSGSLYLYVLSGITGIAMITPLGGTAFIVGWGLFAWALAATTKTP